ncbi:DUF4184 family protein [Microbacterium sp. W1N]|uniref:DUF4184 family protein n=1 Tax=Microbacterium festucae TaxID=2977531 RepID=UPI0021C0CBAE|nr:DUF4184 family protein [Microbacterium festucae]MCT9821449.1 DUF4184 family protein [Microbacterium festucae]
MPFTPSHAVVALPFVRTPLLPAAIAVGAMTPDLPLFLRGTPLTYQATHTNVLLSGLVALVLLVAWYGLLRPAVRELSPDWLARRLPEEWDAVGGAAWRSVRMPRTGARHEVWREPVVFAVLVAASLLLGVVSHIVWDAFTHEGRWGVALAPGLDAAWGPLPGYKWLQYASGVLGLAALGIAALVWLRRRASSSALHRVFPAAVRWLWWLSLPVTLVAAWLIGLAAYGPITADWTVQHLAYRVLPPACAVWGAITVVLCVIVLIRRARR